MMEKRSLKRMPLKMSLKRMMPLKEMREKTMVMKVKTMVMKKPQRILSLLSQKCQDHHLTIWLCHHQWRKDHQWKHHQWRKDHQWKDHQWKHHQWKDHQWRKHHQWKNKKSSHKPNPDLRNLPRNHLTPWPNLNHEQEDRPQSTHKWPNRNPSLEE